VASLQKAWPVVCADLRRSPARCWSTAAGSTTSSPPSAARRCCEGLAGGTVEERVLEDSYHVATLDHDAPAIFDGSLDFVRSHTPAAAG
jgi:carboxylesterase